MFRSALFCSIAIFLSSTLFASADDKSLSKALWVECGEKQSSIDSNKLTNRAAQLAKDDIVTDCGLKVFLKLLANKGRLDWSDNAYYSAARITDIHAKRAFDHLIDHKSYLNWQDDVYFTAAKIDSDRKEALFKSMIDHVNVTDFPRTAYRTLNILKTPQQFEIFEKMISYRFNWKDSVYEAVAKMPEDDKNQYVSQAFLELLKSAKRFDWPAAAYANVVKIQTEDQLQAFKAIIANYNIFVILTTKNFNAGANFLYDGVSPILNALISSSAQEQGMNPYRSAEKLRNSLANIAQHTASSTWESFKSLLSPQNVFAGTLSLKAFTGLFSSLSLNNMSGVLLLTKMRTLGFKGILKEMAGGTGVIFSGAKSTVAGIAGSTTGAALVGAAAIGALSYPYLQSYFEYQTVADLVFDSAAKVSSPIALRVFTSLVKEARITDWPAEAYMEAAGLTTEAQERRFKLLMSKSKVINYYGTTYSIAARDMNDQDHANISFAEQSFTLLASHSPYYTKKYYDWPQFLYEAAASVKNKYAFAIFEDLSKNLALDTRNWLFRNDLVAKTFPEVDNEYSKKAVIRLLNSRFKWAGKVYDSASNIKTETEYNEFLDHMQKNQDNQDWMMSESPALQYASYGLQALFLFAVVSYLASDQHIAIQCGKDCALDKIGKEFLQMLYGQNFNTMQSNTLPMQTQASKAFLSLLPKYDASKQADARLKYLSLVVAVARTHGSLADHPEKSVAFSIEDPESKLYKFLLGYFSFSNAELNNKTLNDLANILEHADDENSRYNVDRYSSTHVYNRTAKGRTIRRSSHLLQKDLINAHQWGIDLRIEDGGPAVSALQGGKSTILFGRFQFEENGPWYTYFKPEEVGIGVDSDNLRHGLEFVDSLGASDSNNRSEKIGKSKDLKALVAAEFYEPQLGESDKAKKAREKKAEKEFDKRTLSDIFKKQVKDKNDFENKVHALYTNDPYFNITTRLGNEIQVQYPENIKRIK